MPTETECSYPICVCCHGPDLSRRAVFRGQLVEAATGRPLEHQRVRVGSHCKRGWEELETDVQGRFQTGELHRMGSVYVELVRPTYRRDAGGVHVAHVDAAAIVPVPIDVGPRLEVSWSPSEVPGPFDAFLVRARAPGSALARARIETGGSRSLRFLEPVPRAEPLWLVLASADGLWFGHTDTALVAGQPAHVKLEPMASLEISLDMEEVLPDPPGSVYWAEHSEAFIEPLDGSCRVLPSHRRRRWLEPGDYRVRARSRYHPEVSRLIRLSGLQRGRIALSVPLAQDRRTIEVVASSETGRHDFAGLRVQFAVGDRSWVLAGPGGDFGIMGCSVGAECDGYFAVAEDAAPPFVSRCRLPGVPSGAVKIHALHPRLGVRTTLDELEDGSTRITACLLDDEGAPGFGFDVQRAGGLPEPGHEGPFVVESRDPHGTPFFPRRAASGVAVLRSYPDGGEWAVRAEGAKPVYGRRADFEEEPGGWFARVRLEPGWGGKVRFVQHPDRPLEGVEVLVDGDPAARSGSDGWVHLESQGIPEAVEVRYGDWTLGHPGSLVQLRSAWVWAYLAPPER